MIRIVSVVTFALVSILSCTGCGSSTTRTAEQKQAATTCEVATCKPVAQETPALGVSAPYQVGTPKGGCKMIVIYDKDGSVHNVAACDSDKNGNVVAVRPLKMSPNAAEIFLQP